MNYEVHYERLIERARGRTLVGYLERHHVLPKCMGGGNAPENIVALTAEEHYVAHQLLVKMHPSVGGLVIAAVRMAKQCSGNKAYGWIRRKMSENFRGKKLSTAHKNKLREASTGRKHSDASKRRMSLVQKGRKVSQEARNKLVAANLGKKQSEETVAKRSAALRENASGRVWSHSDETRGKIALAVAQHLRVNGHPMKGRKHSPEAIAKIKANRKTQVLSDETRARMSESAKRVWAHRAQLKDDGGLICR